MMVQTGFFMLIIAFIGILLWAGICLLVILYRSHQAERHDQRYTPGGTITGFIVTGIIGQVLYWILAWYALNGIASGTVMMAKSNAQKIFETAAAYAENPAHEVIHSVTGSNIHTYDYNYDSLEAEILRAFPYEAEPFWFSVKTDSKGNIIAAYFSYHEFSKNDMKPVDEEIQKKMVLNPYLGKNAIVGVWTAADQQQNALLWGTQTNVD